MKIQATTIKRILAYPAMASITAACTNTPPNKPTDTPQSHEDTHSKKSGQGLLPGWFIDEEPQIQALLGEPPAVQDSQQTNKPGDKFNRPEQRIIGRAKVDTPPSNKSEGTYIKWDEQMTVGDISPL